MNYTTLKKKEKKSVLIRENELLFQFNFKRLFRSLGKFIHYTHYSVTKKVKKKNEYKKKEERLL